MLHPPVTPLIEVFFKTPTLFGMLTLYGRSGRQCSTAVYKPGHFRLDSFQARSLTSHSAQTNQFNVTCLHDGAKLEVINVFISIRSFQIAPIRRQTNNKKSNGQHDYKMTS